MAAEFPPHFQPSTVTAAVFDYGGVLIEGGPGEVRAFGRRIGLSDEAWEPLRRELFGNDSIWSALERGEVSYEDFVVRLRERIAQAGVTIDVETAMTFMGSHDPMAQRERLRPAVLERVAAIRKRMPTALLTNNVVEWRDGWRDLVDVDALFDVIIDSSAVGARKPEPAIYEITREQLGVAHEEIFFLDDIGQNLKAARALGWQTVLFAEADDAVAALDAIIDAHEEVQR